MQKYCIITWQNEVECSINNINLQPFESFSKNRKIQESTLEYRRRKKRKVLQHLAASTCIWRSQFSGDAISGACHLYHIGGSPEPWTPHPHLFAQYRHPPPPAHWRKRLDFWTDEPPPFKILDPPMCHVTSLSNTSIQKTNEMWCNKHWLVIVKFNGYSLMKCQPTK